MKFPTKEHLYENPVTLYICMKITIPCAVFLVLALSLVASVGAESLTATIAVDQAPSDNAYVSATVSSGSIEAGQPLTVSGIATGNVTNVEIWFFGDNYGKNANVPVDASGSFSYSLDTTGLVPEDYYVLVQSPGADGKMALVYDNGTIYNAANASVSVKYVDETTGTVLLNATAGVAALQGLLNEGGVDDVYTKISFEVTAPAAEVATSQAPVQAPATAVPTTKKSPVSSLTVLAGIGLGCSALYGANRIRK